ncbi:cupin domain-containing protein [Pontibacter sp. 172403-2]|nr:cupin domain-containing protein [Pontibacter sp. 172403-2]
MEVKEIYGNGAYKVLELTLAGGETMPRHFVTSDAFIVTEKGQAEVVFQDRSATLLPGETLHIPVREVHSVTASEDFKAIVIF